VVIFITDFRDRGSGAEKRRFFFIQEEKICWAAEIDCNLLDDEVEVCLAGRNTISFASKPQSFLGQEREKTGLQSK